MPLCLQLCQLVLLVSQDQKHPHCQVVALHTLGSASLLFALQRLCNILWLVQYGMTGPHSAGQGKLDFEAERVRLKAQNTEVVMQLQRLHAAHAKTLKVSD